MSAKHRIALAQTRPGLAMLEKAEDLLDDIYRHYQDPTVSDKPSKITIELTVLPDANREKLDITVSAKKTLAPQTSWSGTLYAGINDDGETEVVEFNPRQYRLPYAEPASEAAE